MARHSFRWRGDTYRLDSGTWHFWGRARLIRLPGDDTQFRMTPDEVLFIGFAIKAGYADEEDLDRPQQLPACQAYLEQSGHRIWTATEALQIVRDDTDTEVSTLLLERLEHWYFIRKF